MPIKLECPHCHTTLAVPSRFRGTVADCPQCRGKFQVPVDVPAGAISDSTSLEADSLATAAATARSQSPAASGTAAATTSRTAPAANQLPMTNKAARFIAAETARSPLPVGSDGSLPELHLQEGETRKRPEIKSTTSSPVFMTVLLCVSIGSSLLMLLVDFDAGGRESAAVVDARRENADRFFHDPLPCPRCGKLDVRFNSERGDWSCICGNRWQVDASQVPPPAPYQVYLRRAQQAHIRGDRREELQMYRATLSLLRAEPTKRFQTVTGSEKRDRELEELIVQILKES